MPLETRLSLVARETPSRQTPPPRQLLEASRTRLERRLEEARSTAVSGTWWVRMPRTALFWVVWTTLLPALTVSLLVVAPKPYTREAGSGGMAPTLILPPAAKTSF